MKFLPKNNFTVYTKIHLEQKGYLSEAPLNFVLSESGVSSPGDEYATADKMPYIIHFAKNIILQKLIFTSRPKEKAIEISSFNGIGYQPISYLLQNENEVDFSSVNLYTQQLLLTVGTVDENGNFKPDPRVSGEIKYKYIEKKPPISEFAIFLDNAPIMDGIKFSSKEVTVQLPTKLINDYLREQYEEGQEKVTLPFSFVTDKEGEINAKQATWKFFNELYIPEKKVTEEVKTIKDLFGLKQKCHMDVFQAKREWKETESLLTNQNAFSFGLIVTEDIEVKIPIGVSSTNFSFCLDSCEKWGAKILPHNNENPDTIEVAKNIVNIKLKEGISPDVERFLYIFDSICSIPVEEAENKNIKIKYKDDASFKVWKEGYCIKTVNINPDNDGDNSKLQQEQKGSKKIELFAKNNEDLSSTPIENNVTWLYELYCHYVYYMNVKLGE